MAEVKGKFIMLCGSLMSLYKKQLEEADNVLFSKTGKRCKDLEPEGWYDTKIFDLFMKKYSEGSIAGESAIVTLGRLVYPTVKDTMGLPANIKTPLDLIMFEAEGFMLNHRGEGVVPRQFIIKKEGHVIVKAPAPGYNQKLYEGVYLGILEMFGIKDGKVSMVKDAPDFEYDIRW